jgi:hypothetical protein
VLVGPTLARLLNDPPRLAERMWRTYRELRDWSELREIGIGAGAERPDDAASAVYVRGAVVDAVERLPEGSWIELDAFSEWLRHTSPDLVREELDGRGRMLLEALAWDELERPLVRFIVLGPLYWLGRVVCSQDGKRFARRATPNPQPAEACRWEADDPHAAEQSTRSDDSPQQPLPALAPPDHASPDYASPDHAALDRPPPDHAAPDHAASDRPPRDHTAADHASPDHAALAHASPDQASPAHAPHDDAQPDHAAADRPPPQRSWEQHSGADRREPHTGNEQHTGGKQRTGGDRHPRGEELTATARAELGTLLQAERYLVLHERGRLSRYRLVQQHVAAALGSGGSTDECRRLLRRLTQGALPEHVEQRLSAWSDRFGALTIRPAVLVETRTQAELDHALGEETVKPFVRTRLGPNAAEVIAADALELAAALRESGHLPRVDAALRLGAEPRRGYPGLVDEQVLEFLLVSLLAFQQARPERLAELEGAANLIERLERQFPTERLRTLREAAAGLAGELRSTSPRPAGRPRPKSSRGSRPRASKPGRRGSSRGP